MPDGTLGQRAADRVAAAFGSWRFIVWMTVIIAAWLAWNIVLPATLRFDPYPFIFLTLVLSLQASYAAPLILLAQNRQTEQDRQRAEQDLTADIETLGLVRAIAGRLGISA
ncbi:DUF1003 domain-containing protein [Kitasatospora aureofaciens]|uniref:DUF1003 domain-containing protein n=1 Tax=Kitasatospora aureofaciens TaxID=1894 RepID=UPI00380725FC